MVAAGFFSPVMDMEMITMTFADAGALLAELRSSGQTNARQDRARGLSGGGFFARLSEALNAGMHAGRIPATFEILQGHAWKGERIAATDLTRESDSHPVRFMESVRQRK